MICIPFRGRVEWAAIGEGATAELSSAFETKMGELYYVFESQPQPLIPIPLLGCVFSFGKHVPGTSGHSAAKHFLFDSGRRSLLDLSAARRWRPVAILLGGRWQSLRRQRGWGGIHRWIEQIRYGGKHDCGNAA